MQIANADPLLLAQRHRQLLAPSGGFRPAREASCAESSMSFHPMSRRGGETRRPWRFPNVIVQVLSTGRDSTFAGGLHGASVVMGRKFFCTKAVRCPAMPMALRSPPIVVGIRQTSSANQHRDPKTPLGSDAVSISVTPTMQEMTVRAASRFMVRAISLGVFWPFAPSTGRSSGRESCWPGSAES